MPLSDEHIKHENETYEVYWESAKQGPVAIDVYKWGSKEPIDRNSGTFWAVVNKWKAMR